MPKDITAKHFKPFDRMNETEHKPGSPEAIAMGCTCHPELNRGLDKLFWVDGSCPLHCPPFLANIEQE